MYEPNHQKSLNMICDRKHYGVLWSIQPSQPGAEKVLYIYKTNIQKSDPYQSVGH
jgi:hypothetical protein